MRRKLSRTVRLLELMVRVQAKPRFTAAELAEEFGVSRRTILRDLQALSGMGVPLRSTPGPGGGYSLPRGGRRLSPSMRYPVHPFSSEGISAVTKLRAALPKDAVSELDRLRRHVAVVEPVREYEAPLLGELLSAALEGAHLEVTYDSIRSGVSKRVIFPVGLYASQGFWYYFCLDYRREQNVSLRADRVRKVESVEGFTRPAHVPSSDWVRPVEDGDGEMLEVQAYVSERGMKSFELASLFGKIGRDSKGRGVIVARVPRSEIDYYAARLLSAGTEIKVEWPPELVELMHRTAKEITELYG